ncbi:uncharacterized protein UTRI_03818_B [Ustilago trichophora]|uniref:Uncharacterized protein n=1 Tax=Ustilago trichophora TaxID=86804 RepID=A0A5C3E2G4_9BASI|nr:uncharacterized protein UTRI_03818_B [Ustilago trichophora]
MVRILTILTFALVAILSVAAAPNGSKRRTKGGLYVSYPNKHTTLQRGTNVTFNWRNAPRHKQAKLLLVAVHPESNDKAIFTISDVADARKYDQNQCDQGPKKQHCGSLEWKIPAKIPRGKYYLVIIPYGKKGEGKEYDSQHFTIE